MHKDRSCLYKLNQTTIWQQVQNVYQSSDRPKHENQKKKTRVKKGQKKTDKEIKDIIYSEITQPCTQLKLALASGNTRNLPISFLSETGISLIQEFFNTYGPDYQFEKGNLYYDAKTNPLNHLKAYYKLADLCERSEFKSFMCFPLRKSFIPCYVTLDTMVVNNHIL